MAAVLLAAAPGLGVTGASAQSPFAPLSGTWAGSGIVIFANGARDRIRCRAQNATQANALRHVLRCASDSYQFEMTADISHSAGQLSGEWHEVTRRLSGRVSGQASSGNIRAFVSGSGYQASVDVTTRGNAQTMRIRPDDAEVAEVSIEFQKGAR
jgi:hypothetical protein